MHDRLLTEDQTNDVLMNFKGSSTIGPCYFYAPYMGLPMSNVFYDNKHWDVSFFMASLDERPTWPYHFYRCDRTDFHEPDASLPDAIVVRLANQTGYSFSRMLLLSDNKIYDVCDDYPWKVSIGELIDEEQYHSTNLLIRAVIREFL